MAGLETAMLAACLLPLFNLAQLLSDPAAWTQLMTGFTPNVKTP